ncbi:DNA polymerase/3'-5' exonuclease PolX [Candidatus Mycalebacterium sp.]
MGANRQIAHLFSEIASMLEIQNSNPFKIRAYKKAADLISEMESDLSEMLLAGSDFSSVKGIGKDLSAKIREFFDTGAIEYHGKLRSEVGEGMLEMLKIRGMGPKTARLFSDAGVKSVENLERRLLEGAGEGIAGIGKKKAEAILEALAFYKSNLSVHGLGKALAAARVLRERVLAIDGALDASAVGSLRRMTETVSEIEMLVSFEGDEKRFFNALSALDWTQSVERLKDSGTTKAVVSSDIEIKTVVYLSPPENFYFNLARLTGSESHWKKLTSAKKGKVPRLARSEEDLYSDLGLEFITPELREDGGEIEAAKKSALPGLVELRDIRGDLHTHTDWSDGRDSIGEMARAAFEKGYEYIALTDHSPSSKVANGLDADRLALKTEEVKKINSLLDGIEIFCGSEVDIKPDGSLDYPDDILSELDFVVASIHSSFSQDSDSVTKRVIRALENPFVHALGHPTARIIGRRAPCAMDIEKITDAALSNGKALEINASCDRLDLKDEHARIAARKGVKLIISTDAHAVRHLESMACGVAVARRGWCERENFLNTLPLEDLRGWLKTCG